MFEKRELIRVVRSKEGEVSLDIKGKKSGRGVYICQRLECLKAARKKRSFERALECQMPDEVYEQMEAELKNEQST